MDEINLQLKVEEKKPYSHKYKLYYQNQKSGKSIELYNAERSHE